MPYYSPGYIAGRPTFLELAELERIQNLARLGGEGIREALTTLMVHLDDELVASPQTELAEAGNARLAVFRGRGASAEADFFVVVTGQGNVAVGRAETLSCSSWRRLEGFYSPLFEVLSVSVTEQQRLVGDRLDLYVVTRSFPAGNASEDEIRLYHGLIHVDAAGEPHLELPADDWSGERAPTWQGHDAGKLPEWLRRWRFTHATGIDPLAVSPEAARKLKEIGKRKERDDAEVVALAPHWFGHAMTDEVIIERQGSGRASFPIEDDVRLLALGQSFDGALRGITGADSPRLLAFTAQDKDSGIAIEQTWRQLLPEFPADVVFLPFDTNGSDWSDLLVVFRSGTLTRFHYVGKPAIRRVWHGLWKRLGLDDVDSRLRAAAYAKAENDAWHRPLLFGAVEGVLEGLDGASESQRKQWASEVSTLFRPEEDYQLLSAGIYPLLQRLREELEKKPVPDSCAWDFLRKVLDRIYERQERANVEIRVQIDRVIRSIDPPFPDDGNVLQRRSRRSREDAWQELQGGDDRRAPEELIERCRLGLERWASAYLPADTLRLGRWKRRLLLTGVAGFTTAAESGSRIPWLAIASRGRLAIHRVRRRGKLRIKPAATWHERGNVRICRIPASGNDRLLVANSAGYLHLLSFEPHDSEAQQGTLTKLASHSIAEHGNPPLLWCLAFFRIEAPRGAG